MILDSEFWLGIWTEVVSAIAAWLPRVAGALLILAAGWVIARILQGVLSGLLRRIGLDRLAERAGVSRLLSRGGLDSSVSALTARVIYWIVLLFFLIAASESLGLAGVGETLSRLIAYLPNLLAGALILLLGSALGRIAGDLTAGLAKQAEIASGETLGQVVRFIIIVFAAILALEQLGIETTLLISTALALIGATALALALGFGIGSRELARNIMSGYHVKDAFEPGQQISVREYSGEILAVGPVKTTLRTDAGRITLPNAVLIEEAVVIADREPGEG